LVSCYRTAIRFLFLVVALVQPPLSVAQELNQSSGPLPSPNHLHRSPPLL
jgi:hypothetical protein